jgi:polyphosphate kinase
MVPIQSVEQKDRILNEIIPIYLRDNMRARLLQTDGSYKRVQPREGEVLHRCQEELLALRPGSTPMDARPAANGDGVVAPATAILS